MREIALYGGSFDPVHYGHIRLAWNVWDKLRIPVWMVPAYKHAWNKPLAPWDHRIAMLKLATRGYPKIEIVDFEIDNPKGLTFDMLQIACARHPDIHFKLIVGEDTAQIIKQKWERGLEVLEKCSIIVLPRPGYETHENLWYRKAPHVYLEGSSLRASSTEVKQLLQTNPEQAKMMVGLPVFKYIKENNLYVP